jgi:hypothetical protein
MGDQYLCPVCGYSELSEPPWQNESPSDEICPSCGTHFGFDDVAGGDAGAREVLYRNRRQAWRIAGCPWFSVGRPPPRGWNPYEQLEVVES